MISAYIVCESLGMNKENPQIVQFDVLPVSGDEIIIPHKGAMIKVHVDTRLFNLEMTQQGTVGAYYRANINILSCSVFKKH